MAPPKWPFRVSLLAADTFGVYFPVTWPTEYLIFDSIRYVCESRHLVSAYQTPNCYLISPARGFFPALYLSFDIVTQLGAIKCFGKLRIEGFRWLKEVIVRLEKVNLIEEGFIKI